MIGHSHEDAYEGWNDPDDLLLGYSRRDALEVRAKPSEGGALAVGLFNRGGSDATVAARWSDLGLSGSRIVRDLWRRKDLGTFSDRFEASVPRHGVVLVRLRRVS